MCHERLPNFVLGRVILWRAVASAGTSSLLTVFAMAGFLSQVKTQLWRRLPESSRLFSSCHWKKVPYSFRSMDQTFRCLLPSAQLLISGVLVFPASTVRPSVFKNFDFENSEYSTLAIPLRPSALPIQTMPKSCASRSVKAGPQVTSGHFRWQMNDLLRILS